MGDSRDMLVFKAKLAEEAERYEDMVTYMKTAIKCNDTSLSNEEKVEQRNLLSVAYKNVIGTKRTAWRVISACQDKKTDKLSDQQMDVIKEYKKEIEKELQDIVDGVLALLDDAVLSKFDDSKAEEEAEERAFYYKMKGDYCRYNAEFLDKDDERKAKVVQCALEAYEAANKTASEHLSPTSPIRLGLILNFSVFYYEIERACDKACSLAKKGFDDAIAELDSLSETSYKDSTLIMQLLRDNLTLWTAEAAEAEGQQ